MSTLGELSGPISPAIVLRPYTIQNQLLADPPSQKATDINPWMNARRVSFVALAKEDTLRRVAPDEAFSEAVSGLCPSRLE